MIDPINMAYKIVDRPCIHHKDGHIGNCSVCTRDVLIEVVEAETSKLRAEMDRMKDAYAASQNDLLGVKLKLEEARKVILTLSSSLNHLAPDDGPARRVAGKDIQMARDYLSKTENPKCEGCGSVGGRHWIGCPSADKPFCGCNPRIVDGGICTHCGLAVKTKGEHWAICGWCAGTGVVGPGGAVGNEKCPKCHGAGGFVQNRIVLCPKCGFGKHDGECGTKLKPGEKFGPPACSCQGFLRTPTCPVHR